MPVLKHAKKKLKQDKKRTVDNLRIKNKFKKLLKEAKANPTPESLSAAFSSIDKAAKKFVIHNNKAARLKSSLAKVVSAGPVEKKATPSKAAKQKTKAAKKAANKKK